MASVEVMYAEDDTVSGKYLFNEKQQLFKHETNDYILFKKKLSIQSDQHSLNYNDRMMWIIAQCDKSTEKSQQILYYCPAREATPEIVPRSPWLCYNSTSEDQILFVLMSTNSKNFSYSGWGDSVDTNTNGNIFDINVRKAILIDICKFASYHSWYKHLPLTGNDYILVPKMYGQIRGYRSENRKIDQIRWHCVSTRYDLPKINQTLLAICKKYPMKFNCCFGAGNRSIATRRNPEFKTYMEDAYKPFFKYYKEKEKKSTDSIMDIVFKEENHIQIENGVQCGYKIYDEIVEWFQKWIDLIVNCWIRNNYNKYKEIPHGIALIVVKFCDIAFADVFEKKDYSLTYIND